MKHAAARKAEHYSSRGPTPLQFLRGIAGRDGNLKRDLGGQPEL